MPHAQLPVRASLTLAMHSVCELLAGSGSMKAPSHGDWMVRESTLDIGDFRWDVSTERRLPKFVKDEVQRIVYENVPARFRVRVTFSSVKKWRWEKREG